MKTRFASAVFFLSALAFPAGAQIATTTSLVGTVTDASGKTVPGAKVTAVNSGTHDAYTAITSEQGYYNLQFVAVGDYNIQVEHPGFEITRVTRVHVDINQVVRNDVTLKIGNVVESVTVQATASAIKTDDATVSEVISNVADLPLSGQAGRDPMAIAITTPGVLQGTKSAATGTPPGEDFNGAGTREIQNSMSLDGISIMNNLITTTPTRPMVESVQEVEVQTGTYSAQYGAYLGVHINMVTKSGTNQVHGALVEFFRNQVLDARNFFTLPTPANPTAAKPPLRQNQFGFELDGPVYIPKLYNGKDKTFFMASYEGYRLVQQATSLSTSMPAAFFTGDFSAVPAGSITGGAIKDPLNGNTPFAGNIIPASRISPIVLKLQQYYPGTNLPGLASNYSVPVPTTITTNQTVDRIDQNIGDRIRLYARAHYQSESVFAGSAIPINASTVPVTTTNYTLGYTHTLTPNLVNDFRVGRFFLNTATLNPFASANQTSVGTSLGIAGFNGDSAYNNPGIPDFNITGFNGLNNASSNWYQNDSTVQVSEQISWSHGSHNFMAGAEFRRLATGRAAVNSARGTFTFNGTLTGYAPADFILGVPQSFATPGPEVRGRVAEWRDGFFFLDKWQVSRKLTLNYGIRYELPTVAYTINGIATELNPTQTALVGGTPGYHFTAPNHKDWAPRLGLAYRFNEKTVFRAGGGIYYNPNQTNSYTFLNTNPPYTTILTCTYSSSSGLTVPTLTNPFSAGVCPSAPTAGTIVTDPYHQPTARMNQWSAGLERQVWNGGGFELQYLGSHSYHLDRSYYNNTPLLPGPGAVNSRRPNPLFGVIRTINTDEIANYESLSLIYRQRLARGLQVLASYTWSHTLDVSTDSNGGGAPMDPYLWKLDYGNSNWDVRHRFVGTFVYDIPFFAVSNPVLKGIFTKWQGNGIITLQTGFPFNVSTGTDTANTGAGGTYRPDWVHQPSDNCGRGHLVGCIDATAFTVQDLYPIVPTNFAYGSAGRNLLHGPGAETFNLSLFKNFPIKERLKFQFRVETFALFNHTNFNNPAATLGTSSFGNITSASGNRNIQLGAKLQF
ncbi:MAG TPA: carboxypeptidase regulatory-like domain-containing protein [Bryobacteraceae bacterium]|nr:carboxypeptidase regulatory-like domain-containing protein [Bryobacteraceae bacterium]